MTKKTPYILYKWLSRPHICIIAFILVMLSSCYDEKDFDFDRLSGTYEPTHALPLVNTNLDMWDIMHDYDSVNLEEDENHFLTLIYRGEVFRRNANELFGIEDQSFNENTSFSLPGIIPEGDSVTVPYTQSLDFETGSGNEEFDSLFLKSGNLNLNFTSNLNHDAKIIIRIPSIRENNEVLRRVINYEYQGGQMNVSEDIDLAGDKMILSHPQPGSNRLTVNTTFIIYGDGTPNMPSYNVGITQSFSSIEFSSLFGYFGQQSFPVGEDTINIGLFKNQFFGNLDFKFKEPQLNLTIHNSFGMPIDLQFNKFKAYSDEDSVAIQDVEPLPINSPGIDQIGQTTTTLKEYRNIDGAINISPRYFLLNVLANTNPGGNVGTQNFTTDTSKIDMDIELELPLYGYVDNFILQDTIDFEFENAEEVDWVEFKTVAVNDFPINAKIQIYFTDSSYNILDSLITDEDKQIIDAANVNVSTGEVVNRATEIDTFLIRNESARIENLKNARFFFLRADLQSIKQNNEFPNVKIYSFYRLNMKIGLRTKIKANLN